VNKSHICTQERKKEKNKERKKEREKRVKEKYGGI
jgi:uncharacterized C2H2 Zn-finger protein